MRTIRILRNTGNHLPRFTEGQVVDVPDQTADLLCSQRLAELLRTISPEPLQAIPDNPSIVAAEASLKEIKDRWTSGTSRNEPVAHPISRPKHRPKTKPESKE